METVSDFILGGSRITGDGVCSHEIKRRLLLGSKAMNYQPRQHIKKQRHYFANKGPSSQRYELWCWRRLLRVPWTARRSNQSFLKEISPECLLEGLMLKLKLQYSGQLMQRTDSFENTLMLGKIEDRKRRG